MVLHQQVLYSTMLPQTEDDWKLLGSFTAASKQGEQRFTVQDPQYARYLNFRFKTHWNNEFYCTLSQIK